MIKLYTFIIFFTTILPLILSQKPLICNQTCPGSQLNQVPYPFGFSSNCEIPLDCTSNGEVLIGEFPIQQINHNNLLVSLPARCGRAVNALSHLYSDHYAPTSNNAILMQNCTEQVKVCTVPATMLHTSLEIVNCTNGQGSYGNVSCFSSDGNHNTMFLDYGNVTRFGCRFLFSAVSSEMIGDNSPGVSLDIQMVRLGWWLKGSCDCSYDADCTNIVSPNGNDGYRCTCRNGFVGDGYRASSGCRIVKDAELNTIQAKRVILVTALSIGVGMILVAIILCFRRKLKQRKKVKNNVIVDKFLINHEFLAPKKYSYSQIKKMTNSFKNKLGQGGFSSVYEGKLTNGSIVAVKVLSELKGNGEDFINEVASVGRTSHVNIVNLLGFCSDGHQRALIYEFMPNGSLEKFIYGRESSNNSQLGWDKLQQIAIGIARGLEYLHSGCNTRILHLDIKPHNILLDQNFCPKISDFGLAKLFPEARSKISMSHMRGTPGYIAPELLSRNFGQVSNKSDVYSYGIMILEMFAGKENIEVDQVDHTSDMYFPNWIYKKLHEEQLGLHEIVSDEENNMVRKTIIVGLWCIQTNPLNRPTITRVLEMLEGDIEPEIPPKPYLSYPSRPVSSCSPSTSFPSIK